MCRRTDIENKIMANVMISYLGFEIDGKPSPCHIWTGPTSGEGRGGGYARMSLDGQTVAVHIVRFTNKNGFVPGKKQIDHMCNNRLCVNDEHLQMVTHKKNQKLRIQRARKAKHESQRIPAQHCELRLHDTPIYDGARHGISELFRVLEDGTSSFETTNDGRYPRDDHYWQASASVRSSSLHSSSSVGEG